MDLASERAYQTPLTNSTLLPLLLLSLARQRHAPDTATTINTHYDYIIVGAGSAGSVVASRLSEKSCVSVLLLEAGPPPPLLTEVPVIGRSFWNTDIDWQYRTVPQRYAADAMVNRQVVWPAGKTLGGSSVLNGMVTVRGNRKTYDDWAKDGAEGWSYKDVLPYFKKLEDNRDPEYVANGFHGVGGPVTVHRPRYQSEIRKPIFEAAKKMGYRVVDPNGAKQTGFYDFQATMRSSQRCSTAKVYLVPAENRTNLDILPNAMARKVLIKNRRAVGVKFDFLGTTYEVKARKDVILSAGAINTPQLLMLSGIGPRKELERLKIPVIAELPVGQNFQDHCGSSVSFLLNPDIPPVQLKLTDPASISQYIQNRTGPLGSAEFFSALAFLQERNPSKMDFPRFEVGLAESNAEVFLQTGLKPETYAQVYAPYEGKPFYLCLSALLQPRSRGTVTLQSKNPYDPPMIDPNYYEDPQDIQDVVDGLKVCNRIGNSAAMRRVGSTPFKTLFPTCEKFANDEDSYLWCLAKSFVFTLSHPVGTARMGHPSDPRTVVDPELRVKTIKGLRVIDASIMPIIPSGNTNIPTIMVAEKASDTIKRSIKCHEDREDKEGSETKNLEHRVFPKFPLSEQSDPREISENEARKHDHFDNKWVENSTNTNLRQNKNKLRMITLPKVTPWNKEIPNVVPWNQEMLQAFNADETLPEHSSEDKKRNRPKMLLNEEDIDTTELHPDSVVIQSQTESSLQPARSFQQTRANAESESGYIWGQNIPMNLKNMGVKVINKPKMLLNEEDIDTSELHPDSLFAQPQTESSLQPARPFQQTRVNAESESGYVWGQNIPMNLKNMKDKIRNRPKMLLNEEDIDTTELHPDSVFTQPQSENSFQPIRPFQQTRTNTESESGYVWGKNIPNKSKNIELITNTESKSQLDNSKPLQKTGQVSLSSNKPITSEFNTDQSHKSQELSVCDQEFCRSLINFRQCKRSNSCRKMIEFSAFLYDILCSS